MIVYRGWQQVGGFNLPDGDVFTKAITVNHVGWSKPYEQTGSADIYQTSNETKEQTGMKTRATNVNLPTNNGRVLDFNLDAAAANGFTLR